MYIYTHIRVCTYSNNQNLSGQIIERQNEFISHLFYFLRYYHLYVPSFAF